MYQGNKDIRAFLRFLREKSWERDYKDTKEIKRQGHAHLKQFVGFPVQWRKARITVAEHTVEVVEK